MKILPLILMTGMGDDRAVFRCHGDKRRVRIVGGVTDVRPLALGSNKAGREGEGTQMVGLERCLHLPQRTAPQHPQGAHNHCNSSSGGPAALS